MAGMIDQRLTELGLSLPSPPAAAGAYVPCLLHHGLLYVSGQLPFEKGAIAFSGRLGAELDVEEGRKAAALAACNALAHARRELGDLDRISRCLKITGYVAATPEFTQHAQVLNGASDLIHQIFAGKGQHTRAAVGAVSLPLEAAVEIEFLFAVD